MSCKIIQVRVNFAYETICVLADAENIDFMTPSSDRTICVNTNHQLPIPDCTLTDQYKRHDLCSCAWMKYTAIMNSTSHAVVARPIVVTSHPHTPIIYLFCSGRSLELPSIFLNLIALGFTLKTSSVIRRHYLLIFNDD